MTTTNKILVYVLTAVRWACTGVILLTCVGWIMRFVPPFRAFLNADIVVRYDAMLNQLVRSWVPTDFDDYDFSRILTLAAAIFISDRARVPIASLRFSGQSQSMLPDLHTIQQSVKSPEERKNIALLESRMELARGSGGKPSGFAQRLCPAQKRAGKNRPSPRPSGSRRRINSPGKIQRPRVRRRRAPAEIRRAQHHLDLQGGTGSRGRSLGLRTGPPHRRRSRCLRMVQAGPLGRLRPVHAGGPASRPPRLSVPWAENWLD
jgi:hypothetical protein